MSQFLSNLLNRVRQFRNQLELTEVLVDRSWTIYNNNALIEYEFLRNGEIVVSRNGEGHDGTWRILPSGKLQIKTDLVNYVLLFDFSITGILVMRLSGENNEPFLFFDPRVVTFNTLEQYLENYNGTSSNNFLDSPRNREFQRIFGHLGSNNDQPLNNEL